MVRNKVKLAFISNDSSRKSSFNKRKKGLIKKINEISTLCGIKACAIIYHPNSSNPEFWPSDLGVRQVISEFQTLPEIDQRKKMVDQESFMRQRIVKASEQLRKQKKENRELEMTEVMFQCLHGNMGMSNMNVMDLNDLGYMIDHYLKNINYRVDILCNSGVEMGESSNSVAVVEAYERDGTISAVPPTTSSGATIIEVGSSSSPAIGATFSNPIPQHLYQYQHQLQNHNRDQNKDMEMINHHQQQQPHQQDMILDDSSTDLVVDSSNNITSVINPNHGNNI